MTWVRVDDAFPEHPKLLKAAFALRGRASTARVAGLWLHALCYANRNLTDGVIPKAVARTWTHVDHRPLQVIEAMVKAGLMERAKGDFVLHDYKDYQPTAAAVKRKREVDRLRKRSASSNSASDSAWNPDGVAAASVAPDPTHPNPEDGGRIVRRVPESTHGARDRGRPVFDGTRLRVSRKQHELVVAELGTADIDLYSKYVEWDEELAKTGESFDTLAFIKQRSKDHLATSFAAAVVVATEPEDWRDECKRLHGGECRERLHHHHRIQVDAFRSEGKLVAMVPAAAAGAGQ